MVLVGAAVEPGRIAQVQAPANRKWDRAEWNGTPHSTKCCRKSRRTAAGARRQLHPGPRRGRPEPVWHCAGPPGRRLPMRHGRRRRMPFSIQSISKVFMLTLALNTVGEAVWRRVGREPSGTPFNSIVQLEAEAGIPRNPFINAGALVVTDIAIPSSARPRPSSAAARPGAAGRRATRTSRSTRRSRSRSLPAASATPGWPT